MEKVLSAIIHHSAKSSNPIISATISSTDTIYSLSVGVDLAYKSPIHKHLYTSLVLYLDKHQGLCRRMVDSVQILLCWYQFYTVSSIAVGEEEALYTSIMMTFVSKKTRWRNC